MLNTLTGKRRAYLAALLACAAAIGYVIAQEAAPTLQLATDEEWGDHLVDAAGASLYLYVLDEEGASACVDACATNWPATLVESGVEPTVGEGLDATLVGTITRPDGTVQVTYGGHPLYTFRRDTEPGHVRGQALGDQFFLVSAAGEAVTEKQAVAAVEVPEEEMTALMDAGKLVFNSFCYVCHGTAGQGGVGPAFVGNSQLTDTDYIVNRVLDGFIEHGMPPFAGVLTDDQIAGVLTYIRNSWGNDFGAVLAEEAASRR